MALTSGHQDKRGSQFTYLNTRASPEYADLFEAFKRNILGVNSSQIEI